MAAGTPAVWTFRDAKGNTSAMRGYIITGATDDTEVGNITPTLAALSNAHVRSNRDAAQANVLGNAATYEDVEDKAVVVFQTAAGALHRFQIAAPVAAMFLADQETVDFSGGGVSAFVAAVIANMCSRDGDAFTGAVGGYRRRTKLKRKFTIFTRNPTLSGQGL